MFETDVEDPGLGILRIPDLVVIDEEMERADVDAIDPRHTHLAIEVVSRPNPENDYEGTLRDYPAMGVPHGPSPCEVDTVCYAVAASVAVRCS